MRSSGSPVKPQLGVRRKYLVIKLSKLFITPLLHVHWSTFYLYSNLILVYFVPYALCLNLSKLFITPSTHLFNTINCPSKGGQVHKAQIKEPDCKL